METLGSRIRIARLDKGLTQRELADLIADRKINKARIAQYECNNRVPKQPTLQAIAEVLDSSIEWLLNGDLDSDCPEISLGKRIKQIREARGMSRSELGKALELNNPDIRIGSYENGKKFPRMQMLRNIADALGVSWQWLMTGHIDAVAYMTMNNLGYRLKKVRKARRMTRKEIGDLIGIKYADTRLDAYETGKTYPREKMLNKLAEALEVSSSWLATGKLDNQTVKSLEEKGIFHLVFEPFSEEIKCFYQFRDFLDKNKSVIENTLTIEDYKILTNIIINKID